MLKRIFGLENSQKRKDEEERKSIEIMRDLSALRKTCKENVETAYKKCQEGAVCNDDPLMVKMVKYNASLMKSNETLLRKCDRALLNLQTGDLRRKSAIVDHLNKKEFNAFYKDAKEKTRASNVSKLRRRALKMEKYRLILQNNRSMINECLHNELSDMLENEDDDDNDDDSDDDNCRLTEFIQGVKDRQVIDSLLAAPNPDVTCVQDVDGDNDDPLCEIYEDT